jgi:hypothetical protein
MSVEPAIRQRHRWWRVALLLFVVVPFLPELAIHAVAALAKANGCIIEQKDVCLVAGAKVSEVISDLLTVGLSVAGFAGIGLAAVWLLFCYLLIRRGWEGKSARISLALLVTLIFALLPYLAPGLAIAPLANARCQPNEGGGPCLMFGGDVDGAHQTVVLPWLIFAGVPVALGAPVAYAIMAAIARARRARATRSM